jgi:hypothetical protein
MDDHATVSIDETEAIEERILKMFEREMREIVQQMAAVENPRDLLGRFEFTLRDRMNQVSAKVLQEGLDLAASKKRGRPASRVPNAKQRGNISE